MITVRLEVFDAAHLVLVALKRPMTAELLLRIPLPQFDCHIAGATCEVVASRAKAQIIDHAGVLTQSLLTFASLVVTHFDRCVFT